jgi:hypothetical protein
MEWIARTLRSLRTPLRLCLAGCEQEVRVRLQSYGSEDARLFIRHCLLPLATVESRSTNFPSKGLSKNSVRAGLDKPSVAVKMSLQILRNRRPMLSGRHHRL